MKTQPEILALAEKFGAYMPDVVNPGSCIIFSPDQLTAFATALTGSVPDLVGMEVSMDVSTGEHDIGNRVFGTVMHTQDDGSGGEIILAVEVSRNFTSPVVALMECTRSHPHENMDSLCELRTDIARLENEKASRAPAVALPAEPVMWQLKSYSNTDDGTELHPPYSTTTPEDFPAAIYELNIATSAAQAEPEQTEAQMRNHIEAMVYAQMHPESNLARCYLDVCKQSDAKSTQAERPEPVMIDMSPPATSRDRWMYEQGRLAERDPRTQDAEQTRDAAGKNVWFDPLKGEFVPHPSHIAEPVALPEPAAYRGKYPDGNLSWRWVLCKPADNLDDTEALFTGKQLKEYAQAALAAKGQA